MSGFVYESSAAMGLQDNYLNGSGYDGSLATQQGLTSESPLKLFVQAKRHINETFQAISRYADDSILFLNKYGKDIVDEDKLQAAVDISDMVAGIREVLARDKMKVAFFGRTSNGKSTVINGLLRNKILPSGMGHTTNCFLQVEGTDVADAFLVVEAAPHDRKPVESVSSLANALNSERLDDASLVEIFWPKNKCPLLHDDLVLMDSPGIDVSPNLDAWIDKHCLDADVFVLVSNAESTLMRTEMAFFLKVSQKLSKPNIFILNNRWDAVAAEPENLDLVRKQHVDRSIDFLCNELKVINADEAADRVFFVSAKEVLQTRQAEANGEEPPSTFTEGAQHRYREFEQFELKFEECVSQSAVKTKFDQHNKRGVIIVNDLKEIMAQTLQVADELRKTKTDRRQKLYERLVRTQQEMQLITRDIKDQIINVAAQVENNVSKALNEEIRRLSVLINDYNKPFNADPMVLDIYKKELHSHVERSLGHNLRARLSTTVSNCVEEVESKMVGYIFPLVPNTEYRQTFQLDSKARSFEVFYRFNCESLCSDFQEDLEFRFSLGLISMIKRFRDRRSDRKDNSPKQLISPNLDISSVNLAQEGMLLVALDRLSTTTGGSQTTLGALALGGFLVRTVGWRIIGITVGVYTLIYVYERLTWTNKAKERTFKKQYVNHAMRKLKLVTDLTSANCSHQVRQELSSTFARLCRLTDETMKELDREIQILDKEVEQLTETSTNAVDLKGRAGSLLDNLARFSNRYLLR